MGTRIRDYQKGEHGALLFNDGKIFAIPALPLEEVLIQLELEILSQVVLQRI